MSVDEVTNVLMLVNLCLFMWFLPFLLSKQVSVFFLTKYDMNFVPLEIARVLIFRFLKTSINPCSARHFKVPVTLDSI
jgi:hypothetical protein